MCLLAETLKRYMRSLSCRDINTTLRNRTQTSRRKLSCNSRLLTRSAGALVSGTPAPAIITDWTCQSCRRCCLELECRVVFTAWMRSKLIWQGQHVALPVYQAIVFMYRYQYCWRYLKAV